MFVPGKLFQSNLTNKHTSLVRKFVNHGQMKLHNIGPIYQYGPVMAKKMTFTRGRKALFSKLLHFSLTQRYLSTLRVKLRQSNFNFFNKRWKLTLAILEDFSYCIDWCRCTNEISMYCIAHYSYKLNKKDTKPDNKSSKIIQV